eukprot:scaffold11890_cov112-Isochrysis_galbana.AAC.5
MANNNLALSKRPRNPQQPMRRCAKAPPPRAHCRPFPPAQSTHLCVPQPDASRSATMALRAATETARSSTSRAGGLHEFSLPPHRANLPSSWCPPSK